MSGLNSEVESVLGGLRRALMAGSEEKAVRTGLVLCPSSHSLVLNSSPGLLQFYDTLAPTLSEEVREEEEGGA